MRPTSHYFRTIMVKKYRTILQPLLYQQKKYDNMTKPNLEKYQERQGKVYLITITLLFLITKL